MRLGIDLIADVFPAILESNSKVQLICVGPVIDLYGKFAALKLGRLMQLYPDRVYSRPEFTALPPCVFSGAEFCLIASRDEPFGLVAVEFGRKGALGVGARVGGLGNMPGWWYMIESPVSKHLINQFKQAIHSALASKPTIRAQMRARAAKQRFPVLQWAEDLSLMQDNAIKISQRCLVKNKQDVHNPGLSGTDTPGSGFNTPHTPRRFLGSIPWPLSSNATANAIQTTTNSAIQSGQSTPRPSSPSQTAPDSSAFSLGTRHGPGHVDKREGRRRLTKPPPGSRDGSIGAQLKRLSKSKQSSRENSPSRLKNSGKSSSTNSATPRQADLGTLNPGAENMNRVSRITEIMDEDGAATASVTQGDMYEPSLGDDAAEERSQIQGIHDVRDEEGSLPDEVFMSEAEVEESRNNRRLARLRASISQMEMNAPSSSMPPFAPPPGLPDLDPSTGAGTPSGEEDLLEAQSQDGAAASNDHTEPAAPYLSFNGVVQGKKDYKLQSVEPFFTDPTGLYYNAFDKKLMDLNTKNSESQLCVEEFLMKSEKDWFTRFHNVKMGRSPASTPGSSIFRVGRDTSGQNATDAGSPASSSRRGSSSNVGVNDNNPDQFLLQEGYKPPSGSKKFLQYRVGGWPVYSLLLAFVS